MSKLKVDKEKLFQKIKTLTGTSRCIQRTSKYLYQFYKSSDEIVKIWLQALNSGSDEARISLFYIANEMLQSKTYGNTYFKKAWKPYLIHSINCIKDSSVNDKILRILNIWIERKVYDKAFVEDLIKHLSTAKRNAKNEQQCKEIIMNFDPADCVLKLRELIYVESQTVEPIKLHESSINFDEKLCRATIKKIKDKINCNQFSEQLDQNINHLFQLCTMLEEELKVRQKTFDSVTNAEIYYETQEKETLIVEDAYRRYGIQISKTKSALEEHLDFLMDDTGPIDLDDAPSPGMTPPYIHEEGSKHGLNLRETPMSSDDDASPTQSVKSSDDDTNMDTGTDLDKPYSPTHQIEDFKLEVAKPVATLSSMEAFKLLTSVFSQSLTKKPLTDVNVNVSVTQEVVYNTTTTPVEKQPERSDSKTRKAEDNVNTVIADDFRMISDNKTSNKEEKPNTVIADAFRMISNLTGLKNIRARTISSEPTTTVGTTIPILTTKMSFKTSDECEDDKSGPFAFNESNFSTPNIVNTPENIPHLIYPEMQMSSFSGPIFNSNPLPSHQMFPMFSNTSIPPPPLQGLFNTLSNNPMTFSMPNLSHNSQKNSQSPGSCTEDEDEGAGTPTQDETARLNSTQPVNLFTKNLLPLLSGNTADEISKHIQQALSSGTLPFNLPSLMSVPPKEPGPCPFNPMTAPFNQNNFHRNLAMPFSLMNKSTPIQPIYNPSSNAKPTFGPPRAIRTKRPDVGGCASGDVNEGDTEDSGSMSPVPRAQSPWLDSSGDEDDTGSYGKW